MRLFRLLRHKWNAFQLKRISRRAISQLRVELLQQSTRRHEAIYALAQARGLVHDL